MAEEIPLFYFKGLDADERLKSHTVYESAELAKGTLYSAWFEALKTSPWYRRFCERGRADTDDAQKVYEAFGDLRKTGFEAWWKKRGHRIFAERVPYTPISIVEKTKKRQADSAEERALKIVIEVPLYLDRSHAEQQLHQVLEEAKTKYLQLVEHLRETAPRMRHNRWDYSTADIKPRSDFVRGLAVADIEQRLYAYRVYENHRVRSNFRLYELGRELRIPRSIFHDHFDQQRFLNDSTAKISASRAVYDYIYSTRCLMAYATSGIFPCFKDHPLARMDAEVTAEIGETI